MWKHLFSDKLGTYTSQHGQGLSFLVDENTGSAFLSWGVFEELLELQFYFNVEKGSKKNNLFKQRDLKK